LEETHLLVKDQTRYKKSWFNATNVKSDPFGRFIIVSGLLFCKPIVLVNIYAPNWDDDTFISKVFSLIPELNSHQMIFGGDLNCVINPVLDRSKPTSLNPSKMAKTLSVFMDAIQALQSGKAPGPDKYPIQFYQTFSNKLSPILLDMFNDSLS
uniref:Endonuclease/exonuclease/phosphatase domain-containing protein n=1 Tax=Pygocentrus nattereri TaxID=42514 RepID=A0AAR2LV40_PYGNA